MQLLERSHVLDRLGGLAAEARRGRGSFVAIGGSAGVGKTSVVERFTRGRSDDRVLIGHCDSLATPRPLGPLHDIQAQPGSALRPIGDYETRFELFDDVTYLMNRRPSPTILVIEDIHWADEATLDLLLFVGRRVASMSGMLVATYRDDEVPGVLGRVLGQAASFRSFERVRLEPLSREAVAELAAGTSIDPDRLFELTNGNPFYATEVLGESSIEVPASVLDAVLARASNLSADARRVVDAASVVPTAVEPWLLEGLCGSAFTERVLDGTSSLMVDTGDAFRFRHEIGRLAIESALARPERDRLHLAAARLLMNPPNGDPDAARISHHAHEAHANSITREWGPIAARQAIRTGAAVQAHNHYIQVLSAIPQNDPSARRSILLEATQIAHSVGERESNIRMTTELIEICRSINDRRGEALGLARRGPSSVTGESTRNDLNAAVAIADTDPDLPDMGEVYAMAGGYAMLERRLSEAVELERRALARRDLDTLTKVRTLNGLGTALVMQDDPAGVGYVLESADLASQNRMPVMEHWAYANLGSGLGERRKYAEAIPFLHRAIEINRQFDVDPWDNYGIAWLGRVFFEQGRYSEAALQLGALIERGTMVPETRATAFTTSGRMSVRRGRPEGASLLREVDGLVASMGLLQREWPWASGMAEAASLDGRMNDIEAIVKRPLERALDLRSDWAIGELAYWHWIGTGDVVDLTHAAQPYRSMIEGDWEESARAWSELGCPYEEAQSLAMGPTEAQLRAVTILDGLGAAPLSKHVKRTLRESGISVPRGPYSAARSHPLGLTARQAEVLDLLSEGLSNRQIADRLFISHRTAAHHVSAVLAKLEVKTRGEAATMAREQRPDTRTD